MTTMKGTVLKRKRLAGGLTGILILYGYCQPFCSMGIHKIITYGRRWIGIVYLFAMCPCPLAEISVLVRLRLTLEGTAPTLQLELVCDNGICHISDREEEIILPL